MRVLAIARCFPGFLDAGFDRPVNDHFCCAEHEPAIGEVVVSVLRREVLLQDDNGKVLRRDGESDARSQPV